MKPPMLEYFDFVLIFGCKESQFSFAVVDQEEATGVELNLEDAEDLLKRLASLLFTDEPTKETK